MADELRMRALTSKKIRIQSPEREAITETGRAGGVLIVDDRKNSYERIVETLSAEHTVEVEPDPNEALFHAAEGGYDLVIVSLGLQNFDGLRLCSQVRSLERTRNVPILAVSEADNNARLLRGLEIGVNGYLIRPIDKNEMPPNASARRSRRSATPNGCATTCRSPSRWRSPTRSPACSTAATWKAIWAC